MNNFEQYAPTRVIFGKGTEEQAGAEVRRAGGSRVLLVYGGGSAKKSGLIDRVKASLTEAAVTCMEFGGAKANPTLAHAEEGIKVALEDNVDFILAVGGGSAIDTAKAIAHGTANSEYKLWDIWKKKVPLTKSLPVGAILTIAAAGSEMSDSAVLTNEELGVKAGINTEYNRCKFAIMNPELVYTLPDYQLSAGISDIMMHTMERYFIPGIKCDMTDEIAEGLLRTVIKNAEIVVKDKTNYDAQAEIMWCSSLSHNNLTECGRGKDFSVHKFGHALSAVFDYTHGASLTSVWPSWARYLYKDAPERFAKFARKVWNISEEDDLKAAEMGIDATEAFFRKIGMPVRLKEIGPDVDWNDEILKKLSMLATLNDTVKLTRIKPVGAKEAEEIYRSAIG
ncbi:iron-containing alcohol dehydrogenase [Lachnospiraceae bacterium C1.1]|nr:iron-containing alcohol dehydrogenase [Lachnospiraceae bacterium C1.1]